MSASKRSATPAGVVVLFDVDNTLIDVTRLRSELTSRIKRVLGTSHAARFWELYARIREKRADEDGVGRPDVGATVDHLASELPNESQRDALRHAVFDIDFRSLLFEGALEAIAYGATVGTTVILSDGDDRFQPHKIRQSGLEEAVEGRVLVTARKERALDEVRARFPAEHYVMVDDRPRIHAALKGALGEAVTTVLVGAGETNEGAGEAPGGPPPDVAIASIAEFASLSRATLLLA